MSTFKFNAANRTDLGKGASRRLRHAGQVPAIVYGADKEPVSITLEHKDVIKAQENEAFYTSIITLVIDGNEEQVVIKDMQRHPFKPKVNHLDFLRVDANSTITKVVPFHFVNEETAAAVKEGGKVQHLASEMEVSCLAKDLPEFIEIDVAAVAMGETLHLSNLALPAGVASVELAKGEAHDLAVVTIVAPKGGEVSEDAAE